MPLAPCLLAALTPEEHEVSFVDTFFGDQVDYESDVDVVAIAVRTPLATIAYEIADNFQQRGKKVVFGGPHLFNFPEQAKQHRPSMSAKYAQYSEARMDVLPIQIPSMRARSGKAGASFTICAFLGLGLYRHAAIFTQRASSDSGGTNVAGAATAGLQNRALVPDDDDLSASQNYRQRGATTSTDIHELPSFFTFLEVGSLQNPLQSKSLFWGGSAMKKNDSPGIRFRRPDHFEAPFRRQTVDFDNSACYAGFRRRVKDYAIFRRLFSSFDA